MVELWLLEFRELPDLRLLKFTVLSMLSGLLDLLFWAFSTDACLLDLLFLSSVSTALWLRWWNLSLVLGPLALWSSIRLLKLLVFPDLLFSSSFHTVSWEGWWCLALFLGPLNPLTFISLPRSLAVFIGFLAIVIPILVKRSSRLYLCRLPIVYNRRSNVGVSPVREEADNHVSLVNNEGRLDDDSGSNDVRLNGGIEESERRAGETPGPSTAHGTDGVESLVQSVMVPFLRQVVDNLANWEEMFEEFNLENVLRDTPPYSDQLKQIRDNVRTDFQQLLQLRETNPNLSSEDLKVYCVPLCWPSNKRVGFWSDLSDELLSRADELEKLRLELDRMWQLHFGEKRNDKIDDGLLSSADELKKLMLEFENTWQPYFGKKRNDKIEELLSRVDELKKSMLEFKRTWWMLEFKRTWQRFGVKRKDKMDELLLRADELLSRADKLKKLRLELERTWQLHFGEKQNDKIDGEWIEKFGEKDWQPHFGEKWIDKIDEKWIEKNGKKWIEENIEIEEWIDKTIEKWIENVDPKYKPRGSDFIFVRGLLRFMRNRQHHSDEFQKSQKLRSVESFYNYFDTLFPCLLMVSYGVAYRFCREEPWFEKYR